MNILFGLSKFDALNIKLNWSKNEPALNSFEASVGRKIEHVVHSAEFVELSESKLKMAVIDCIGKAASLLSDNIVDDSRYFMFEWDVVYSTLTVVVTDDAKENDSRHVVKCFMSGLDEKMSEHARSSEETWELEAEAFSEVVKEWVYDYLTTCGAFLKYSLIAVFHNESREHAKIL